MAISIPHDVILHHILPWLPPKSVAHFMCVSKEFHSFLSSKTFKKMHKKMHIHHDKFLVLINDYNERRTLGTIDCEAPNDVLTFKLPMECKEVRFLTSFDGLVCVRITTEQSQQQQQQQQQTQSCQGRVRGTTKQSHYLILLNPLTSDWKRLSDQPKDHYLGSLGLFYSSCEDDYKLVSVLCYSNIFYIYSLKSDSWKKVTFEGISNLEKYHLSRQGTCLNENLYFINDNKKYSVVRFDTKTETFTEMKTFNYLNDDTAYYRAFLMIKNGCIYVCITYEPYFGMGCFEIEFWKIDEEGNWKKMETCRVDTGYMRVMKPLHLTSNGNLLMLGYKWVKPSEYYSGYHYNYYYKNESKKGNLYKVDLKKKHSKGKGTDKETRCSDIDISDIVRYIETSVSPNQYIK